MSDKEKKQPEITTLDTLGARLKKKREANSLALQDYAERLKIRYNYLVSIENGQPENLPGAVFFISFAKSYANALGLDGEDFASQTRKALQEKGLLGKFPLSINQQQTSHHRHTRDAPAVDSSLSQGTATVTQKRQLSTDKIEASNNPVLVPPYSYLTGNDKFPTKLATNAETEKQALRETIFSPIFVIGGAILVVLLYLGSVIVTDLLGKREKGRELAELVATIDNATGELATGELAAGELTASLALEEEKGEQPYEAKAYGALGPTRVILKAQEKCWIAVFATESEPELSQEAELLFVGDLKAGDVYRVPVQLGIILKSGNLSALHFEVHGVKVEPFRIQNPSGFMSLEPVHLRGKISVREGGAIARERLPVVREIELLREHRAKEALENQKNTQ